MKLSIDIGYGDCKVAFEKDGKLEFFKFPTAIQRAKTNYSSFGDEEVYEFRGAKYKVGEQAVNGALSTRNLDFIIKYAPLLIYYAIKKANIDTNNLEISTGLSILNWNKVDEFTHALETININNEIITQSNIEVFAQGQGVFIDYPGNKDGIVVVTDIGYNTFDFLVFENGTPKPELSFATERGLNILIEEIINVVKQKYDWTITEQKAKDIFVKGYIENFGNRVDLSDTIEELKEYYTDEILNEMKSKRLDVLREAQAVIFSGGGAYYLEKKELSDNVVFANKPYEFANVRGYYNG